MIKSIFTVIVKIIGAFIAGIIGYIAIEFVCARISVNNEQARQPIAYEIYLLSNGVHTDIVLPVHTPVINWTNIFPVHNTKAADTTMKYIAIGWGDKGFYLETPEWSQLKASVAFNAVTGLGDAALHVTYYNQMEVSDRCIKIGISANQYNAIRDYVLQSLDKNSVGNPIVIDTDAQYGHFDAFYEATGSYHLFHTCNTWTNNALKAASMKACLWNTFDKGLFYIYR